MATPFEGGLRVGIRRLWERTSWGLGILVLMSRHLLYRIIPALQWVDMKSHYGGNWYGPQMQQCFARRTSQYDTCGTHGFMYLGALEIQGPPWLITLP